VKADWSGGMSACCNICIMAAGRKELTQRTIRYLSYTKKTNVSSKLSYVCYLQLANLLNSTAQLNSKKLNVKASHLAKQMPVYLVCLIHSTEAMLEHHPMCGNLVHKNTTCVSPPDDGSEIFLTQRRT